MGKRKIIWSNKANRKLFEIMEFYAQRNSSKTYSIKLFQRFQRELTVLIKQPEIGIKTEIESVRGLIVDDYILFYEYDREMVIIHTIWDNRQDPNELRIK
jgi:addiction module RelE/StbE family toxin